MCVKSPYLEEALQSHMGFAHIEWTSRIPYTKGPLHIQRGFVHTYIHTYAHFGLSPYRHGGGWWSFYTEGFHKAPGSFAKPIYRGDFSKPLGASQSLRGLCKTPRVFAHTEGALQILYIEGAMQSSYNEGNLQSPRSLPIHKGFCTYRGVLRSPLGFVHMHIHMHILVLLPTDMRDISWSFYKRVPCKAPRSFAHTVGLDQVLTFFW